ncbi:hypothetical protein MTR67_051196 [Solanum verrucosum]|uniref:Uncharacterized protein n=1 Tax=Solanum verrucosum TaxID=315347 RepID=A0AAF0ZZX2_SOLVR|nr:hypothetical protein MTR67_051196 [Solanum verrucosum]
MSIVTNKFVELPSLIVYPKLKLLILKVYSKDRFKLHDDFFYGMGELNVLSLSGYKCSFLCFPPSILPFPTFIKRLSSLRMLCLSHIMLDDKPITGKLVTLEILNIRECELEELSVEIGKLTNLIMLELWNK